MDGVGHKLIGALRAECTSGQPDAYALRRLKALVDELYEAFQRLKDLGWQEAIYCPKDGTVFDAVQAGITKTADCRYVGEWPKGRWEVIADGDLWPAHPILWRAKDE